MQSNILSNNKLKQNEITRIDSAETNEKFNIKFQTWKHIPTV